VTSGSAFNPQISVILDGNYYQDDAKAGDGAALVGEAFWPGRNLAHDHSAAGDGHTHGDGGHVHNVAEPGFNFREAELSFSATVDPYFDAATYISIDGDGNVELEEAYFETRALPWGLKVKGGKFLSDFGYINRQHPHQWAFVDQNLPYLNLLGFHGLQDTGLQLTWVPDDLPFYALIGGEALQGNQEIFGATVSEAEQVALNLGKTQDGPRLFTAFGKVAPDLGRKHALQFGLSYAHADQQQQVRTHTHVVAHEHEVSTTRTMPTRMKTTTKTMSTPRTRPTTRTMSMQRQTKTSCTPTATASPRNCMRRASPATPTSGVLTWSTSTMHPRPTARVTSFSRPSTCAPSRT
jgi:hypothetical protein